VLSEAAARCKVYREAWVEEAKWEQWVKKGYLSPVAEKKEETKSAANATAELNVAPSPIPPSYDLPASAMLGDKPYHQPHLENFFEAVRTGGKTKLNCPAEIGYETAVTVLKVNEAIESGKKIEFKPEDFVV
jgi:hypothetical protein